MSRALITLQEAVTLHYSIIEKFGGGKGNRNLNELVAAIESPYVTWDNQELYETNLKKCCKIFASVIQHHPFVDGNKRVGLAVFLLGLKKSGFDYKSFSNEEVFNMAMDLANGDCDWITIYNKCYNKFGVE